MDLINAEGEAELQVGKRQHEVRRRDSCGSPKHLLLTCQLRKQHQTPISRDPAPNQNFGNARKKRRHLVGAGHPIGEEIFFIKPLKGNVDQGLAPKRSMPVDTERGYKPGLLVAETERL